MLAAAVRGPAPPLLVAGVRPARTRSRQRQFPFLITQRNFRSHPAIRTQKLRWVMLRGRPLSIRGSGGGQGLGMGHRALVSCLLVLSVRQISRGACDGRWGAGEAGPPREHGPAPTPPQGHPRRPAKMRAGRKGAAGPHAAGHTWAPAKGRPRARPGTQRFLWPRPCFYDFTHLHTWGSIGAPRGTWRDSREVAGGYHMIAKYLTAGKKRPGAEHRGGQLCDSGYLLPFMDLRSCRICSISDQIIRFASCRVSRFPSSRISR